MTPIEDKLKEIEELCEAATEGPWFTDVCHVGESCWCRTVGNKEGDDSLEHCIIPSGSVGEPDAKFIAQSRDLVPRLVKAVRLKERSIYEAMDIVRSCRQWNYLIHDLADHFNKYENQIEQILNGGGDE